MDDRFLKTVSDGTRDTWKLTMNPIVLAQQRDEDFVAKYAYMDTQTKVHLLLQFSIVGHEYNLKHGEMIKQFVALCSQDEEEWVSKIASILFSSKSENRASSSIIDEGKQQLVSSFLSNSLFQSPLPTSLQSTPQVFGEWEQRIKARSMPTPIQVSLRTPEPPIVKGKVGTIRKRNREPTGTEKNDAKKIKKVTVFTGSDKPKVVVHVKREKMLVQSPKETPKRVKTEPVASDLTPLKMASDVAYVALGLDPQSESRCTSRWRQVCDGFKIPSVSKSRDSEFPRSTLTVNLLRMIAYDGVQNELSSVMNAFIHGEVPSNYTWKDEEKKEVDVVVGQQLNPRRIQVLRLHFQDFSWELIEYR